MPRGGARPGAGRKPNPESARQKALATKAAQAAAGAGFTLGDGARAPGAPAAWPFGTMPPAPPVAAPAPAAAAAPEEEEIEVPPENALAYFQSIYKKVGADERLRIQAALAALPFETAKPAPVGKKDAKKADAKAAGGGKFAAAAPPRLVASNGART